MSIAWSTEITESKTKKRSEDGLWTMYENTTGESRFFRLYTNQFLAPPCGEGQTEAETWKNFIAECHEAEQKLKDAIAEAERHLASLEQ